ncbi:uncharacterized protein EV154DRAFT_501490 [Mucor mucedo]|uniref:uncharacterized protein n=1 Tax=Mucor mucedo TaxID=29922 RepID=UPI0022211B86|nr:uncharacterized protein EV154DRAFT_501490 [Mucor mucedo]KAI7893533.1 hypothetical protein EV154DRAFT_501490 [Mucor mucedo]
MPFRSTAPIPSVKTANKSAPPSTIRLKGWLNKQKHGKCKAWLKRYFVLYGEELRYYKNKNDTNALAVISLDHYSLVANAQPLTSMNQKQWRYHTFCLVSDDDTKFDWPDYFLQAENDCERADWVDSLHDHVSQSKSVLEKWLERLDMPAEEITVMTSIYSHDDIDPSQEKASVLSSVNLPPPLHHQKSNESFGTLATHSSLSVDGESSKRRPSDFTASRSTELITGKLFSTKIFNWSRTKSSASSVTSSARSISTSIIENQSSEFLSAPHTPFKPIESPIIHPSEYNHDDDPMDRLNASLKNSKSTTNDPTTNYYYTQKIMHEKEPTTV